ncbi:protein HEATR9 isoform X2 [Notamacropus eugenii]|uniref:protein HEATR9 isoform X2 n=1 Tax=Notamacropus eugenii TaxID=9315 RepID=UPI003B679A06
MGINLSISKYGELLTLHQSSEKCVRTHWCHPICTFFLMASETGDVHRSKTHMEKLPRLSIGIPELKWKTQEDIEKSKTQHNDADYSHRIPSRHQVVSAILPPSPFIWRKSTPWNPKNSSQVMRYPDIFMGPEKIPHRDWESCNVRKKRVKFSTEKTHMARECFINPMKWKRLKDLTHSLSSPVEAEQVYAAQALGKLRIRKKFIIEALWVSAQVGPERVRYESSRTLAILGCLHKHVILSLIEHLKGCSLSRRMDTLMGLHMALNAWITIAKHKALVVLVKLMNVHTLPVLQAAMEQILTSYVAKHRIEAIKLLKIFGLEKIRNLGMENDIFELLRLKVHDDPLQEVRETVAEIVEALKMKPMMLNIVESQLNDPSALVRHEAVISIGVLGICSSRMFYFLMDMLDLETNLLVRKELEKIFITLFKKDPWVWAKLQDWTLLVEEGSRKERERIQTLKLQKKRRDLQQQKKSLVGDLAPLIPRKAIRPRRVMAEQGRSIFDVPIKGIALASHYPPCITLFEEKDHSLPKESKITWDSRVIRQHLKNLASH